MNPEHKRIMDEVFPGNTGGQKADVLYDLAREATGPIVEVGSAYGFGTVALALGSQAGNSVPVFAIDPHLDYRGWSGEVYEPDGASRWFLNCHAAGVLDTVWAVMLPVESIVGCWPNPASLTFWDLGRVVHGTDVGRWLRDWCHYAMLPGDLVAINETGADNLGVDEWLAEQGQLVRLVDIRYYIRIAERR